MDMMKQSCWITREWSVKEVVKTLFLVNDGDLYTPPRASSLFTRDHKGFRNHFGQPNGFDCERGRSTQGNVIHC